MSTTGWTWKAGRDDHRGRRPGQVSHLFSTGANDVVVVRGDRERMIPFVLPDFVKSVDFEANLVVVDWDPEF